MFNQIKSLSKSLPVRKNPLVKEEKPEISELAGILIIYNFYTLFYFIYKYYKN